jgi:hypothetical protein
MRYPIQTSRERVEYVKRVRTKLNNGHPSALGSTDRAKMILWLDQGALP